MAWISLSTLIVLAFFSGSARAAEDRVSVVVHAADSFSRRPAAYFEHLASVRWSAEEQVQVVGSEAWLLTPEDPDQERLFAEALALLEQGVSAYDNLEPDKALNGLGRAVSKFEQAPLRLLQQTGPYIKALTYLAASRILKGDLQGGQDGFRRVLLANPEAGLDKRVFPPGMVSMFEAARRDLVTDPTGMLSVVSSPEHARVYLGGIFRGVTPCDIDGLPYGQHLLELRKAGYDPWAKAVQLRSGLDNSLSCRLESARDGVRLLQALAQAADGMDEGASLKADLGALAAGAGLGRVLVGRLSQRDGALGLRLALYSMDSGQVIRVYDGRLPAEGSAYAKAVHAVVTFMLSGREDVLQSSPNLIAVKTTGPIQLDRDGFHDHQDETPLVKRWWFWTAIALGAAAVATGVTLGLLLQDESQPGSQILLEF